MYYSASLLVLISYATSLAWSEPELISAVVIFRHGDRPPLGPPYPNDPYKDPSFWPVDWGQLTNLGKQQHYELGQWYRQRYADFLPEKYSEKDIYVRTTDVDRTHMSAASNLAGLYPPKGKQVWNDKIQWQPIPIHTEPESEDPILAFQLPCPRKTQLIEKLRDSDEFKKYDADNQELYQFLNNATGNSYTSFGQLESLYGNLFIEELYNYTLPDWTEEVYPDKLLPWAELNFRVPTYTTELARLQTGPFFQELVNHFGYFANQPVKASWDRKFIMLSAHDSTLADVLNSMGLFEPHWPPYAATVIFEMFKDEDGEYIDILYKNSTEPQLLKLEGCDVHCNYTSFVDILEPITVDLIQWEKECQGS